MTEFKVGDVVRAKPEWQPIGWDTKKIISIELCKDKADCKRCKQCNGQTINLEGVDKRCPPCFEIVISAKQSKHIGSRTGIILPKSKDYIRFIQR